MKRIYVGGSIVLTIKVSKIKYITNFERVRNVIYVQSTYKLEKVSFVPSTHRSCVHSWHMKFSYECLERRSRYSFFLFMDVFTRYGLREGLCADPTNDSYCEEVWLYTRFYLRESRR